MIFCHRKSTTWHSHPVAYLERGALFLLMIGGTKVVNGWLSPDHDARSDNGCLHPKNPSKNKELVTLFEVFHIWCFLIWACEVECMSHIRQLLSDNWLFLHIYNCSILWPILFFIHCFLWFVKPQGTEGVNIELLHKSRAYLSNTGFPQNIFFVGFNFNFINSEDSFETGAKVSLLIHTSSKKSGQL